MNEKESKTATGCVEEVLPNSLFRVRLVKEESSPEEELQCSLETPEEVSGNRNIPDDTKEGELILAYLAGKMRLHRIRVLVGDQVEMVLDPYGGRARIVRRLT